MANSFGYGQKLQPQRRYVKCIIPPEGTPSFYSNFIEVSNSPWDFALIFAKLPAKPTASSIETMKVSGKLQLTAEITINFPPTLRWCALSYTGIKRIDVVAYNMPIPT